MLLAIVATALAAQPAPELRGPTLGTGAATVTVVVRGVPAGGRVEADLSGVGAIAMADPGLGYAVAHFHPEASRTAQLRLTSLTTGRQPLVDQTILLVEGGETVVTYQMSGLPGQLAAERVPGAPSAGATWATDEAGAAQVRGAWAALGLAYGVGLALVWARRA